MTATVSQPAQNAATDAPVENGAKTSGGIPSQDVGLIFVREYYTFLNKNPHKLYGFYGNDSLMVRGDEGEAALTIRGTEEIRKKIDELGFNDCRVLVTQVDSQVSASNGLLVQVLGEMCNTNAPVQKFSQTFFLAPQTNGFYVLNDIFRCLKDDVEIDYYTCDENNNKQTTTTHHHQQQQQQPKEVAPAAVAEQQQQQPETPLPASQTSAASTTAPASAAPTIATTATTVTTTEAGELDSTAATTSSTPVIESAQTPVAIAAEEPKEPEEKPAAQAQQQQEEKMSSEKKSNTPQTWANLAAARNEPPKWGGAAAAAAPATPEPKGSSAPSTAPQQQQQQQQQQQSKPKNHEHREPVPKEMTEVFLKNTKNLTVEQVKEVFGAEFGEVKSVTLNPPPRNNGFLNFAVPESCQKALGQRKVTVGETTVLVEERRTPTNKFNRQNGGPYSERKYQQNQHRRGGGAPRGGGNKSRGGGNQKQ
ncbi:hypothetical protein BDB00DRAFT_38720 [Zychaea mexicana]|uniref:uncharacterized protein n=1 Tax=Zychaea mexicana TaxID=64656 RepID=UPI0022FE61BE|nr:uncharacterized protein BDB00DRAFT_38720 [Zychaea mexicana]KAI9488542.1 hypothetical protein BDB00DRAFT_38720 [Zychaea mexicana]